MVKQLDEHRRNTDLYLKILNRAIEINDYHLACIVRNKLKHHNHQEYSIATPTGGVIIRFPNCPQPEARSDPSLSQPAQESRKVWMDWAIGLGVFPGSILVMMGFVLIFS